MEPSPPGIKFDFVQRESEPWNELAKAWYASGKTSAHKSSHGVTISPGGVMIFLHGLNTPSGELFLANVQQGYRTETGLNFASYVRVALTRSEKPGEFRAFEEFLSLVTAPTSPLTKPMTLYAAHVDTPDGMTFTMEYEVGGVKGHIRGKYTQRPLAVVKAAGTVNFPRLTMEIVDGPLKP